MEALQMDALERYLTDCENKRRRMRDRPSDAVVAQLRTLLQRFDAVPRAPSANDPDASTGASEPSLPSA